MMTPTRTLQVINVIEDFGLDPEEASNTISAFITWAHINDNGEEAPSELFARFKNSEVGKLHLD